MNFICLIKGHNWRFSHNHGVPLGDKRPMGKVLADFESGKAYSVYECQCCHRQSRMVDDERVILKPHEMEAP